MATTILNKALQKAIDKVLAAFPGATAHEVGTSGKFEIHFGDDTRVLHMEGSGIGTSRQKVTFGISWIDVHGFRQWADDPSCLTKAIAAIKELGW